LSTGVLEFLALLVLIIRLVLWQNASVQALLQNSLAAVLGKQEPVAL